ncbi:unnamed protein product [Caenorhabditis sp. 36 PRJEB53466]|nr:unnamed protein product [Caenorhabditis sp. 36 PRJEB53466]
MSDDERIVPPHSASPPSPLHGPLDPGWRSPLQWSTEARQPSSRRCYLIRHLLHPLGTDHSTRDGDPRCSDQQRPGNHRADGATSFGTSSIRSARTTRPGMEMAAAVINKGPATIIVLADPARSRLPPLTTTRKDPGAIRYGGRVKPDVKRTVLPYPALSHLLLHIHTLSSQHGPPEPGE